VRRSYRRGIVSPTKTSKVRRIPLHGMIREALDRLRQTDRDRGVHRIGDALVFPSEQTGGHHSATYLVKPFQRMREQAKIPIRFTPHGMRRTYNNLMRQLGTGQVLLHATIGHSSDRMTEHYSHVGIEEKAAAVERLARAISGAEMAP
jgi:integrase/recombinase XerD